MAKYINLCILFQAFIYLNTTVNPIIITSESTL